MEKLFEFKNGKVKVTYNEQLMTKEYEEQCLSKIIPHKTKTFSESFSLGVELMIHVGPRICYGMLVAQVMPYDEQDFIKVLISFTRENTIRYRDSILLNDEYVYEGLPEEYVEQVSDSIYQAIGEKEAYPQCHIYFGHSANCEVGSSPMFFSIIAEMIINILYDNSMEDIFSMDKEEFKEKYMTKV